MREKVRPIFVYLTIIAAFLGTIGIIIIAKPTGKVVSEQYFYKLEEVQKHNNNKECWIYFGNKVYDITLFLQVYEDEVLKQSCGGGVSFDIFEENVKKILEEYKIGLLK